MSFGQMKHRMILLMALVLLVCGLGMSAAAAENAGGTTAAETAETTVVKKGLVKVNGFYYYYKSGKALKKTWKKIDGKKYYFKASGKAAVGAVKIKKVYYLFSENGVLRSGKKTRTVEYNGKTYLVNRDGQIQSGFRMVNGKFYYFSTTAKYYGQMVKNKTVQGVKLGKDGAVKGNPTMVRAHARAQGILNSITNAGMSQSQKLRAAWNYVVSHIHYSSKYPNLGNGLWPRDLGLDALSTGSGNCYGYACAFAALAYEAGYYPVLVNGRVPGRRDGAADGYTRHCWVEINGLSYDPEGQAAGWACGIYGTSGYPMGYAVSRTAYRLS